MPRRALVLKKESLTDLTGPELAALAGAQPETYDCYTAGPQCFVRESLRRCNVPTVLPELCIEPV